MMKRTFRGLFNDAAGNLGAKVCRHLRHPARLQCGRMDLGAGGVPRLPGSDRHRIPRLYTFGLRHAVDADHIAAIDNVTRKLMQEGKRPLSVGLFFSLGHSTVVVLGSVGVSRGRAQAAAAL